MALLFLTLYDFYKTHLISSSHSSKKIASFDVTPNEIRKNFFLIKNREAAILLSRSQSFDHEVSHNGECVLQKI